MILGSDIAHHLSRTRQEMLSAGDGASTKVSLIHGELALRHLARAFLLCTAAMRRGRLVRD